MTTFDKAKAAFMSNQFNWPGCRMNMSGRDAVRIAAVLTSFSRYMFAAYDLFFVENERGAAYVTAISEEGIRVEYFEGSHKGEYEWIHAINHVGNADATTRTFVEQPHLS